MTGRQKMQAALSKEGTKEFPAVICYEDLFIRDHWGQLTACPWWYAQDTDIERQTMWRREAIPKIGQDWFSLPMGSTAEDRENIQICAREDGVFAVDRRTRGEQGERRLREPKIGGEDYQPWNRPDAPKTPEEIDRHFPAALPDPADIQKEGRKDLADRLLCGVCAGLYPISHITSPLQSCVWLFGFEGFMANLIDSPALIKYACERFTSSIIYTVRQAKILGAEALWVEECYLDMIGPGMFEEFSMPYTTRVVEAIRECGMKSTYYHTGDPAKKLKQILDIGADAISFEEGKKNFVIDIEDVVEQVQGRCAVLGNLDATHFLPACTYDELKTEIKRFAEAGKKNRNRYVMSTGSPVTPGTSVEKVRMYCDLVHELGL